MCSKVSIGVIGCANIAERYVIPSILKLCDKFNLIGVSSRTQIKANYFADVFKTTAYYSYQELLEEKKLDAVYIPLPNSMHYKWIKKALNKELHVLVEKSIACEYKEVLELNELAQSKGLVLIENFQFRFHTQLEYIKNLITSNKIGELRNIRSSFGFPPFTDKDNIRYNKSLGGGALLDVGAYPIKITQEFLGNDVYIDSASIYVDSITNVDIWGGGQIKSNNSPLNSQIAFGFDNFYQCNLEIWGTKGLVRAKRIFTAPPSYKPEIELLTDDGRELITLPEDDHFKNLLSHFHGLIVNKDKFNTEYERNINQARLIKEFREQANVN